MFPGATQIFQDLFIPTSGHLDSWGPHSTETVLDTKAWGADTVRTERYSAAEALAQA